MRERCRDQIDFLSEDGRPRLQPLRVHIGIGPDTAEVPATVGPTHAATGVAAIIIEQLECQVAALASQLEETESDRKRLQDCLHNGAVAAPAASSSDCDPLQHGAVMGFVHEVFRGHCAGSGPGITVADLKRLLHDGTKPN